MKCVLINSWYRQYSTGKLVAAFRQHLIDEGHEVHTYYGRGEKTEDKNVFFVGTKFDVYSHLLFSRMTGYQGCYSASSTKKMINNIEQFKPDVVYLFNLHAYYLNEFMLLNYLKEKRVKVVYMLFDEYPYLGKCCFAAECDKFQTECNKCPQVRTYPISLFFDRSRFLFNKKKELFSDWKELTLAGVEFLQKQASVSAISKNTKFRCIDMGVQLKKTYYPREVEELRKKLNLSNECKVVITVGPYSDERKGIKKLVEIAKKCKDKDIVFINIGFDGKESDLPENFMGISYVSNQDELAEYYSLADVYVMTSSGEGMSLTCMEALGCGTKLIGFDISGTPYAANEEFGTFVPFDDLDAFTEAICVAEKKNEESIQRCREYALSRYEISDYVKNLEMIALDE